MSMSPRSRAFQRISDPASSDWCLAAAPVSGARHTSISPRITDSVNFLEPTRISTFRSSVAGELTPQRHREHKEMKEESRKLELLRVMIGGSKRNCNGVFSF